MATPDAPTAVYKLPRIPARTYITMRETLAQRMEELEVAMEALTSYMDIVEGRLSSGHIEAAHNAESITLEATREVLNRMEALASSVHSLGTGIKRAIDSRI